MGDIINELNRRHSLRDEHNDNECITITITPLRGSELNSPALERGLRGVSLKVASNQQVKLDTINSLFRHMCVSTNYFINYFFNFCFHKYAVCEKQLNNLAILNELHILQSKT